jgi:hypothetical protein
MMQCGTQCAKRATDTQEFFNCVLFDWLYGIIKTENIQPLKIHVVGCIRSLFLMRGKNVWKFSNTNLQ